MGRFIVVVLVMAVIAFLANRYLLHGGDAPPPGSYDEADEKTGGETSVEEKVAGDNAANAEEARAKKEPVGPDVLPGEAPKSVVEPDVKAVESAETVAADSPSSDPETIMLGSDELYDGIPGNGDLTVAQVKQWLADPTNHVALKPELPLGLAAGAGEIKGLEENPLTRAKIELGRQLFFDPRISSDNSISCASCHHPDHGYGKDTQFGVGVDGQEGTRNSPVAYNRIFSDLQFWDGRAPTLEEQAKGPIANPIEMGNTHEATVADLKSVPQYVLQFEAIFDNGDGNDAVEINNAAKALAAFERTLVTGPTPWDYYKDLDSFEQQFAAEIEDLEALKEEDEEFYDEYMDLKQAADSNPLSEAARRGGALFFGDKAGCTQCHLGANFTDEKYHNLGVGMDVDQPDENTDWGRYAETKQDEDRGAFKTPTVRNISATGPYMHDGSQKTLEEVVDWYDKGGHPNQWLSDKIKPLKLTDQEKQDLVNFMKEGLQGELPQVEQARLPPGAEKSDAVAIDK